MELLSVVGPLLGAESLGILSRFIHKMGYKIVNWLLLFLLFLALFAVTMNILFPQLTQFRTVWDACIALFLLSTVGEPIEGFPPLYEDSWTILQAPWPNNGMVGGSFNSIAFFFLYIVWIYLSLIMLLNLLIAQVLLTPNS